MGLSFIGVSSLNESELSKLSDYSEKFYNKSCKHLNDPLVILHVKKKKTAGKRCKYSVHSRVEAPTLLASAEYSDWDFGRTLKKTLEKVTLELENKFKSKKQRVSFKKAMKEDVE